MSAPAGYIRIDYGHGVVRYFSRRQVRLLRKYLGISGKAAFIEATREWAESIPSMSRELSFCR